MSKLKHPMHILVIDKEFTDELPGMNLKHGVTRLTTTQYAYWLDHAVSHLMTGQREKMEFDPRFRQILPYTIVAFVDLNEDGDWAHTPIFVYQRTKKIGEERLAGNYSIGAGGHVDHADVKVHHSIVDFQNTLAHNLEREVANEELRFVFQGKEITPVSDPGFFTYVPFGLIRDDSNNVGKVHLGVVNVIYVPKGTEVSCKEEELITHKPMTPLELKASGLKFEGWTQILIDELAGVPCSVAPTPCREAMYDMLLGEYFITARKGDKWTELAIEFNTTVATLYRLNMAAFEDNELAEGTRVNVPEQPGKLVKIETPSNLIEALNNDTEGARAKTERIVGESIIADSQAKMTSLVLQGILDHGPDYSNCALRFLVKQDMADRLVALDSRIADLIKQDIVSIVPENYIPEDMVALDPATAEMAKSGNISWHFPGSDRETLAAPNALPELEFAEPAGMLAMPNPDEGDLADPVFNAIWNVIKNWDVNVPTHYTGYCGANGSHVMLIVDELRKTTKLEKPTTEGGLTVTGGFVEEADFAQQVKLGEANGTPRHVLMNGDSINSICETYKISHEDFERWNGFQHGHAWPTFTGYVFIADPAKKWVPLLETNINDVTV